MTQEIIEMARQAGWTDDLLEVSFVLPMLEAFAKLVAAKAFQDGYEKGIAAFNEAVSLEREACAELRNMLHGFDGKGRQEMVDAMNRGLDEYQALIKARGQA